MKKKILNLLLALSPVLFLISCGDEEIGPAPTITVSDAPTAALPGEVISIEVSVNAPNGGDRLNAFVGTTQIANIDLGGQTTSAQTFDYTIPTNAVIGSQVVITLQASDRSSLPSQLVNLTVNVNDPVIVLEGNLTSQTLDASQSYLLKGQVFIKDGITVNIPAGTIIKGDKATKATLVVERGGVLNCNGTAQAPVVMTSSQGVGERDRGDWGGLVILGKAFSNQPNPAIEGISPAVFFGAENRANDTDNSGTYKYLRVEYAGIELTPNNETNSITMGGVGSGTTMEYLQTSYGGDDNFEWFGGAVDGKYFVSLSAWDDSFDGDYGWSGKIQFALAVRNPFYADQSQSNGFEIDNGPNDNDTGAGTYTTATFSNVTVYGPRDRVGRSISANNVHGMDLRRRVAVSIFNSVITGFPTGLRFNQASVLAQYQGGTGVLANNVLVAGTSYAAGSGVNVADVQAYWEDASRNNLTLAIPSADNEATFYGDLGLRIDNFFARYTIATYPANPNFTLSSGTATLATGASFTNAKLSDPFFTATTYRGAFDGTTDWTDGWAEFRPIDQAY